MEDAPLPTMMTPKDNISESFEIKQDENNYKLNIEIINQDITMILVNKKELMKEYEIKLTWDELKEIHKIFSMFTSCQDFVDYIRALIEKNQLSIKKETENKISIEFIAEYLFKQNVIKIPLSQKKINFELIAQDLYNKIIELTENFKNL